MMDIVQQAVKGVSTQTVPNVVKRSEMESHGASGHAKTLEGTPDAKYRLGE
jgi:hypothetical protein